jgi:hypothetical protein
MQTSFMVATTNLTQNEGTGASTEDAVTVKGNQTMYHDHYAEATTRQAALRQEAARERLARAASQRSPPRLGTRFTTLCSALARRFPGVPRREHQPVGALEELP